MKRTYCPNDCDYLKYYSNQAGSGLSDIRIFRGFPYQRGNGIGSIVRRFGVPLLQFLGKHLLSTGMSIGSDILASKKPDIKQHIKVGAKSAAKEGLNKLSNLVDQVGSGRKKASNKKTQRKKVYKKVSKRDIFS